MIPPRGSAPPLDCHGLLRQCGGDRELAQAILDSYRIDGGPLLDNLDTALARGDRDAASLHAHSLKGLAAYLCAEELQRLARLLEEEVEDAPLELLTATVSGIRTAHERLLAFLDAAAKGR